jgi:hypothetical protein
MNLKKIILLCSLCVFFLSSCIPGEGEETLSADQVLTFVAETVNAALSLTPQATETYTPTVTATATVTGTPTPSPSPTRTNTIISSEGTGGSGGQTGDCDNATFVSDLTIPDGTVFAPGASFTKSWRMHNSGTCTWTSAYSVIFVKGEIMSGISPQYLISETASGVGRDISVELVAPSTAGTYTGYWQLRNSGEQTFGQQFYVEIAVSGDTQTPTATATGATATPTETPTQDSAGTSTAAAATIAAATANAASNSAATAAAAPAATAAAQTATSAAGTQAAIDATATQASIDATATQGAADATATQQQAETLTASP